MSPQPTYDVRIVNEFYPVEQLSSDGDFEFGKLGSSSNITTSEGSTWQDFGKTDAWMQGQSFKYSVRTRITGIKVKIKRIGTGHDNIHRVGAALLDSSKNLLQYCTTDYLYSDFSTTGTAKTFLFDYICEKDTTYFFVVFTTRFLDDSNYFSILLTTDTYTNGNRVSSGTPSESLVDGCEAQDWTESGSALAEVLNGSVKTQGLYSLDIGCNSTASYAYYYKSETSFNLELAMLICDIWLHADHVSDTIYYSIALATSGLGGWATATIQDGGKPSSSGWNTLYWGIPDGGFGWSNMQYLNVDDTEVVRYGFRDATSTLSSGDMKMDNYRKMYPTFSDESDDLYFEVLGDETITSFGQSFKLDGFDATLTQVSVDLTAVGTPGDSVKMELRSSVGALLATSTDLHSTGGEKAFSFNYSISKDTTYYFFVYRSSDDHDNSNYWKVKKNSTDLYNNGNSAQYEGVITNLTGDLWFKIQFSGVESENVYEDILEVVINVGKSDVDSTIIEGVADITFENKDSKYSPTNTSSPFYGIFRVNNKVSIKVTYDSTEYNLFKGYITSIIPDYLFKRRVVNVKLSDQLYPFKEVNINISPSPTGKTASELITSVLQEMGLTPSDYDVQADNQVLKNSTDWSEVNGLSRLNELVEVGQHHHFVDGDGKYIFKNNQWLSSNTPKYTYQSEDPDDAKIEDMLDGVRNKVRVKWGSSWAEKENTESQNKYGERVEELDNQFMPDGDAVYASFIAEYIRDMKKEPGNSLVITISDLYPDVLNITFGDPVRFIDTFSGIDNIFTVFTLTHTITRGVEHRLELKTRKFVLPISLVSYYDLEPFQGDQWLNLSNDAFELAQGFKLVTGSGGKVYFATMTLRHDLSESQEIQVKIYAADVSGQPTGSVLATSNVLIFPAGYTNATYEFSFPEGERPTLTTGGNGYCIVLNCVKSDAWPLSLVIGNTVISDASAEAWSQSFQISYRAKLYTARMEVSRDIDEGIVSLRAKLYAADGSGLPTGSVLATSDYTTYSGTGVKSVYFIFPELYELQATTDYCIVLENESTVWKMYGRTDNPYAGQTAGKKISSAWQVITNNDFGLALFLKEYINYWYVWGQDTDQYANGEPSEKGESGWTSLDPWDFYFKLKVVEVT